MGGVYSWHADGHPCQTPLVADRFHPRARGDDHSRSARYSQSTGHPRERERGARPVLVFCKPFFLGGEMICKFLLAVEETNFHPGGTSLRGEAMAPSARCALKPKKDNAGRMHDPIRWVMSGGSPVTVAHMCSGNCPLNVPAEVGSYGRSFTGPCPVCRRDGRLTAPGKIKCKDCGTVFSLVFNINQ